MKKLHIFILLYLSAYMLAAQQSDMSNMYPLNTYLINSAATGNDSTWRIFTGYRKQWNGISNAPSLGYLGLSGRVGRSHGVGLIVEQSKYGLLSDLNAKLSYAYHFTLSPGKSLHAGASMGFINRSFETSDVIATDYSDDLLRQNSLTGTAILSDIGIMFTSQRLLLGASLPQIISYNASSENNPGFPGYYTLHASYDVSNSATWLLQAVAAHRKNGLLKSETDIGARALWKGQVGGGVGYRTVDGVFLRAEIHRQNLAFAYSYEHGTSSTGKSHEFGVSLRFGKRKKGPVASEAILEPVAEEPVQNSIAVVTDTVATDSVVRDLEPREPVVAAAEVIEEKKIVNRDSLNRILEGERLIFFELKSADKILSENYETTIDLVAQVLKENPEMKVTIVGHTCKLGREEVNQRISEDRAHQVYDALINRGISQERMEYLGKGEGEPIDKGNSPEQLARNRRVQMIFQVMTE